LDIDADIFLEAIGQPVKVVKKVRPVLCSAPMNRDEMADWRRKRLALIVKEMGSRPLGLAIGLSSGDQIRGMLSGARYVSDKTVDKIEALPGRQGWFFPVKPAMALEEGILGCLRYQREFLELLTPANRQLARLTLKHFVDNPDELLTVAQVLQKLSDAS
jgi:hypothetical protein